jgi:uncharacterized protein with HEPN domain
MKERDDLPYLRHMLDAVARIEQLQILGEAVRHLSQELRAAVA